MSLLLIAVILGIVEGITEFLPVSSTGHMILVGHIVHFTDERASVFEVFIQLGAICAIIVAYWPRLLGLLRPADERQGFTGFRGLALLAVTTVPAVILGSIAHGYIKRHLFTPFTVACGLAIGGLWIILTERLLRNRRNASLDTINWKDALGIGCFQCLALWPGMSRSGSTILGGMLLGLERRAATEYSFFAAIPVMFAACLFDLLKGLSSLHREDLLIFGIGFAVAFVSALFAVKLFIRFLTRHTLEGFGWYRLVVSAVAFWFVFH